MKQNINELVCNLLIDEKYQKKIIDEFKENPDVFEHSSIEEYCKYSSTLDPKVLLKLLNSYSKDNKKIKEIIPYILYYADEKSITDEIFNEILHFDRNYRNTLLIVLAHCKISFYQLEYINKLQICDEAFCQLLYIYSTNEIFTAEDLKVFLQKTKKFKKSTIKMHIKYMLEKDKLHISIEKINILHYFMNKL